MTVTATEALSIIEPIAASSHPYGVLTLDQLDAECDKASQTEWLVESFLPCGGVDLMAGDSGLGKSPFAYQLGCCVATGLPFLGWPTRKGRVLYLDLENGLFDIQELKERVKRHLGIEPNPPDLLVLPATNGVSLSKIVGACRPDLLLIDSLRAFDPNAERDNSTGGTAMNELRAAGRKFGTTILVIHHTKKPGEEGALVLQDTPIMQWLNQVNGARALVNQSDTRIAVDGDTGFIGNGVPQPAGDAFERVALVLKWHRRLHGEFGPIYLSRVFDSEGEPVGYQRVSTIALLRNADQQSAFLRLPNEFSFKQAKATYDRADQATSDFLRKCASLGLTRRDGKSYRKTGAA